MLRYYEEIGLLQSLKKDEYAYRVYDTHSISRLRQIIVLRKLRIPLKQIAMIFENPDTRTILQVFMDNVNEISDEITALTTMRRILGSFIGELRARSGISLESVLFSDEAVLGAISSLSLTKINFKEEKPMDELNKASKELSKLKNVRIVQLPPFTVASYHFIGENPEEKVGEVMGKFLQDIKLYDIKPDARMFGFNHPNPSKDREHHGYEDWVTIPENLEVPEPFVKKYFPGGMYAVHSIVFGNFHEWELLSEWVENSKKYEPNYAPEGVEIMSGCLEEHLNWVYCNHLGWPEELTGKWQEGEEAGIDLYLPVKLRK